MVSALFIRPDSIYKTLGIDCWDINRDALNWPGGNAAIFHPPCRGWSRMRGFSHATEQEKALGVWSVDQVRKWGGVLEHPAASLLWSHCKLPLDGRPDPHGGFTLSVNLHWFGFPAQKPTYLYIVGCRLRDVPPYPLCFDAVTHTISASTARHKTGKKEIKKSMRDKTPEKMAVWLIDICKIINTNGYGQRNDKAVLQGGISGLPQI